MSFSLKYIPVTRTENYMVKKNPLKRGTGRVVGLEDRVDTLENSFVWNDTINDWHSQGKMFDMDRFPKFSLEKLGDLLIDEDIQRGLDVRHSAYTIANPDKFDPALLQPMQCIKTSDGKFISIDSQHTAAVIAGLVSAGLVPNCTDWREFKFWFQYIETDSRSYARKSFSWLNGKGKKKQSVYQQLRTSVFTIRIDHDLSDPDDVGKERKVSIAESHECFPVEEKSPFLQYPGTFTNIGHFLALTDEEIDLACAWHNQYFHFKGIHVSLFFIFKDICRDFESAKMVPSEQLLEDLAALVQQQFGSLSQYSECVKKALGDRNESRYGYRGTWKDDYYAFPLLQLYQKLGGKEPIAPTLLDRERDVVRFFAPEVLEV